MIRGPWRVNADCVYQHQTANGDGVRWEEQAMEKQVKQYNIDSDMSCRAHRCVSR